GNGGFKAPVKAWDNDDTVNSSWDWNRIKPVAGDFDGDGKTDIAFVYNNGQNGGGKNMLTIYRLTSNGTAFTTPVNAWDNNDTVNSSWDWNRIKPVASDFSGTGKADIALLYNNGQTGTGKNITTLYKFANNGNGDFKTPVKAWDNDDNVNSSWDWNRATLLAGDFSGTGKNDVVVVYNNGQTGTGKNITTLYKFANNGSGDFKTPVKAWDNDDTVNSSWDWNRIKPVTGDFDGDGKTDIAFVYNNGQNSSGKNMLTIYRLTSNGTAFTAPVNAWDNNDTVNSSWNWNQAVFG
ncbi:FG-GAP-like repeat-containing protein, partial [Kitasatospora sp. NPDC056138]|uniref:FG-GAP-like repeat-containing protein n=1 Tax=Kitasatospora sp. NPDC056138 TaxID=3345724 RepID=UPI0035DC664C